MAVTMTDIMAAEFIRTFPTAPFYGGELLRRLRQLTQDKHEGLGNDDESRTCARIPRPPLQGRQRDGAQMSFTDTYGYRGSDSRVYYLNA